MSFGTTVRSEILEKAIKDADKAGILMIAAAGNRGNVENSVEYPASFDEVVAVGAVTPKGELSDFSSVGSQVEILAPGESVPSTGFFDEIIETEGTSIAAPHVTGVASILVAKDKTKSSKFIRELLKYTSKSIDHYGVGVVDLDYALAAYDTFSNEYVENAIENDGIISENETPIEIYTDAEVEALWKGKDHKEAVDSSSDISSNVK